MGFVLLALAIICFIILLQDLVFCARFQQLEDENDRIFELLLDRSFHDKD